MRRCATEKNTGGGGQSASKAARCEEATRAAVEHAKARRSRRESRAKSLTSSRVKDLVLKWGGSEDDGMSDLDDEIDIAAEAEEEEGEGDEEGNGDEEKKGEDGDGDHNDMNDESNDVPLMSSQMQQKLWPVSALRRAILRRSLKSSSTFLQVYGLLVSFNLSIKWPVNWDYFSKFFFGWLPSIFIIDFDYIYRLADIEVSTDVYVYLMFGGIVSSVMVALGLYFYFHGLSKRKFIKNNIDNWGSKSASF